ncbi:bifunctional riboflavin kinase/FAD synthetase [Phormidium tenue FACHB-886]|nr:bifunctional riboflavin kinase/FAD synthetase [Phormidium tenue FACHB-886]
MWIASSLSTVKAPTCVALGNFDGVHRGHRQVIQPVCQLLQNARAGRTAPTGSPAAESAERLYDLSIKAFSDSALATVLTFRPHPQEFFSKQRRLLLTPLAEKIHYLEEMGVEQLVLLPFDQALANLSPQEFFEKILVQCLQVQCISVGQDFRFGQRRAGTTQDLQTIAAQHRIPVGITPLHCCKAERISSSAIRLALEQGDLDRANLLLGRPYALLGEVVQGQQLGRTIGFPTANLQLPPEKFLPRQGVYSVWVHLGGLKSGGLERKSDLLPGVMNIGVRPTLNGVQQTIEVHLLDWSADLYGQTIAVYLDGFLRPEQKFASLDELKAQIQRDSETARTRLLQQL